MRTRYKYMGYFMGLKHRHYNLSKTKEIAKIIVFLFTRLKIPQGKISRFDSSLLRVQYRNNKDTPWYEKDDIFFKKASRYRKHKNATEREIKYGDVLFF